MTSLTLPPSPASLTLAPLEAVVVVDGLPRPDLIVLELEHAPGPQFGSATLSLHDWAGPASSLDPALLPPVGSGVQILCRDGQVLLAGSVAEHRVQVSDDGEQVLARVVHAMTHRLRQSLLCRHHASQAGPVIVQDVPVRFNTDPTAYASADPVSLNGRSCRLFDARPSAIPWTLADAMAYLLAAYLPEGVEAPALADLADLAGPVELPAMDVSGRSAYDVLASLAGHAGLRIRAGADAASLAFYRPGVDGPDRRVGLQPAGQALQLDQTNLHRADIQLTARPAAPTLLLLGQPKRYEVTFSLLPGWDPCVSVARWRDTVRSLSSDWLMYADVFRKWVLNEHGWYSGPPWNLATTSFAAISAADFPLSVPRPLGPCLSTNAAGASLGIVLELRLSASQPWRRWRGPLWTSATQAAVYLGGDALPCDYFDAALAGTAQLRVTATVQADTRLSLRIDGDESVPAQLVEIPRAGWAAVSPASVFLGQSGLGAPAVCDDTPLLQAWADARGQLLAPACAASLELGWMDTSMAVGDRVERIAGRPIELRGSGNVSPRIDAVRHDFANQLTHLTVVG